MLEFIGWILLRSRVSLTTSTAYEKALAALGQCTHLFYLQSTRNWIQAYKPDCSAWEWEQVREACWRRLLVLEKPLLHEEWGFKLKSKEDVPCIVEGLVEAQTAKALLLVVRGEHKTTRHWIPKSQIIKQKWNLAASRATLELPPWLYIKITAEHA